MGLVLAALGGWAFWLLYAWMAAAIACSELSRRKGYGEKVGLGTGLLLSVVGLVIWIVLPPKEGSQWKRRAARREAASS